MRYTTNDYDDELLVTIDEFGHEGWTITISKWIDGENDYEVLYDRNVVAESGHEALTDAFCEVGWDYDDANIQANEWGFWSLADLGLDWEDN